MLWGGTGNRDFDGGGWIKGGRFMRGLSCPLRFVYLTRRWVAGIARLEALLGGCLILMGGMSGRSLFGC